MATLRPSPPRLGDFSSVYGELFGHNGPPSADDTRLEDRVALDLKLPSWCGAVSLSGSHSQDSCPPQTPTRHDSQQGEASVLLKSFIDNFSPSSGVPSVISSPSTHSLRGTPSTSLDGSDLPSTCASTPQSASCLERCRPAVTKIGVSNPRLSFDYEQLPVKAVIWAETQRAMSLVCSVQGLYAFHHWHATSQASQMLNKGLPQLDRAVGLNYTALARAGPLRESQRLRGLFDDPLPWFCPVPLQPLSGLHHVKYLDYHPPPPPDDDLFSNDAVKPVYISTRQAKMNLICARLGLEVSMDTKPYQCDPCSLKASLESSRAPIHVFVDLSNIIIGFYKLIKRNRNISDSDKVRAVPFYFGGLAVILQRWRPVTKMIVAGSTPHLGKTKWPGYMKDAAALGFEMNILSRVNKLQSPSQARNGGGKGGSNAVNKSTSNSSDEDVPVGNLNWTGPAAAGPALKTTEQCVDEILHLKMCESIIDYDKGTIVLATGDGAPAEFSGGFVAQVERALAKGWHVELVSWSSAISSEWQRLVDSGKWTNRFRIVLLDWYVEELFDSSNHQHV